jgi:hypothetical protein
METRRERPLCRLAAIKPAWSVGKMAGPILEYSQDHRETVRGVLKRD